ncbi:NAD(P)/FAD-dependent oxidoreductase (plasmid) [Ralstonia solanacearum]|uniref:NAD(P)/FAD-dependent oxidoreductase n=2 Tax=Ralstonia pseudosolanacearum TaxID=1310165 RepID=UPI000903BD46|nr:hypothetical protein BCR16_23740 [Ralstonia solanacearum FJAT-1458]KAF3458898.1 NAD(P)/FAD-dependent oxidoreductase [Ralstonia solanacearum]NKA80152.1 NAD(P)/FAD-dependent oxidoreductase [Ralstonia solanacearum]NKG01257.1 NAD(P)/FAD-dependent oxidoreductase [Ralstonia solanacearum]NKG04336.1 NAD(P)/FAD-dependent oxidoreductase [Ralstonia solanacearum]
MSATMQSETVYDAVIVGGGVAGGTAALLLRQRGCSVALLEKRPLDYYKALCTHFIQPSAVPILRRVGLDHVLEPEASTRTKASFVTSEGVIDTPGGYTDDVATAYAYNLERRVLDPALRARARSEGVDLLDEATVTACRLQADGLWRVEADADTDGARHPRVLRARVVIAADGRRSQMAQWLNNAAVQHDNQRAAVFAQFEGIAAPGGNRSLFILAEREMGFVYPLTGGRTLLSAYVEKDRAAQWRHSADAGAPLLDFFARLAPGLDLAGARLLTPVLGYADYPSQFRRPVCGAVPFIGDAALSLDPMSGVGCGFAMEAAALLDEHLGPALQAQGNSAIGPALDAYASRFDTHFAAHARGIVADSLIAKQPAAQAALYRAVIADPALQRDYLALTGRLITPQAFQRAYFSAHVRSQRAATAHAHPPERASELS